jgi:hypothetical protein
MRDNPIASRGRICQVRRRLFNVLAALSLLLLITIGALWLRSFWRGCTVIAFHQWTTGTDVTNGSLTLQSGRGNAALMVTRYRADATAARRAGISGTQGYDLNATEHWSLTPADYTGGLVPKPWRRIWQVAGFAATCSHQDTHMAGSQYFARQAAPAIYDEVAVFVPYWFLFLPTIWFPSRWWVMHRRTARYRNTGQCPTCGYDLRATPDRCPECGAISTVHAVQSGA